MTPRSDPNTVRLLLILFLLCLSIPSARTQNTLTVDASQVDVTISRHIYGHFAEHLGRCIYDGLYVGEDNNTIPNTAGVRKDIIDALQKLKIPNLRWPGGCFADTYHWKEAIGPKSERVAIENMSWGNIREDNSFGTHEFLDLCELLGAEPYLAVNMNSGTVREAVEWVQYVNHANGTSALTDERAANGRETPWHVKYWGIGNESWDCGGNMTAEYYSNLYKQYATAMTSYANSEKLFRVAVGPGWANYDWTRTIMKNIPARRIEGLSIHHYSVIDWSKKGSSTEFTDEEYYQTLSKAWFMEEFITRNSAVMDTFDPEKKVALIVDEWGGWYDTDPEGRGELYQQNTIRDAMIAGMTLNIFNNHADRVRMANLAQLVNVLQAVILTDEERIVRTPTYHVMEMYNVHQDARLVPSECRASELAIGDAHIPSTTASASLDSNNVLHISLAHMRKEQSEDIVIDVKGYRYSKVTSRILTSGDVRDHNAFENPDFVSPKPYTGFTQKDNLLTVRMPPNAVIVMTLEQ